MATIAVLETYDHPEAGKGFAVIRVSGAAEFGSTVKLFIRRMGYDDADLGPWGWRSGEYAIQPAQALVDGDELLLPVGRRVVGHLETGAYQIELASDDGERASTVMAWSNVSPCAPPKEGEDDEAELRIFAQQGRAEPEPDRLAPSGVVPPAESEPAPAEAEVAGPEVTTEPSVDEPPEEPEPTPGDEELPGPGAGNMKLIIIICVVVGLLMLGGIAWLTMSLLGGSGDTDPVTTEQPEQSGEDDKPAEPEPPAEDDTADEDAGGGSPVIGVNLAEWNSRSADEQYERALQLLQEAQDSPDAAELKRQAELLLDWAKVQGKAEAALALGGLYDTRDGDGGRSMQMDADVTAAYNYYREALAMGSPAAEQKLCELRADVERMAGEGDSAAQRLLRPIFRWPDCQ